VRPAFAVSSGCMSVGHCFICGDDWRMIRKSSVLNVMSALFIVMPRASASYALYVLAPIFIIDHRSITTGKIVVMMAVSIWVLVAYLVSEYFNDLSPTAALIEYMLSVPLALYLLGVRTYMTHVDATNILRFISVFLLVTSFGNLVYLGFPVKLPYVDYLPDQYFATYGVGGSRIVTLFGFMSLIVELFYVDRKSRLFIFIASINFLMPSYIIGIACGLGALAYKHAMRKKTMIIILVLAAPSLMYAQYRLENLNSIFLEDYGYVPKVYGFILAGEFLFKDVATFVFGGGIGQVSSTAAKWSSIYLNAFSREVPDLPYLYMSSVHEQVYGDALSYAFTHYNVISSAVNKPYNTYTTIIMEYGVFLGLLVLFLWGKLYYRSLKNNIQSTMVVFALALFVFDVWHDSPWLAYMLILSTAYDSYGGECESDIHNGGREERNYCS